MYSYLSSIQRNNLTPYRVVAIHLKWTRVHSFGEVDSGIKSTKKSNLRATCYLNAFMLDEQEVHMYTIVSSLSPSVMLHHSEWVIQQAYICTNLQMVIGGANQNKKHNTTIMHLRWRPESGEEDVFPGA